MVASGERERLLSPPEQQVRMYSTKLSPQVIYAMTHEDAKDVAPTQTARR
jgi:hypothetical protein